jgi:hypothetical protein
MQNGNETTHLGWSSHWLILVRTMIQQRKFFVIVPSLMDSYKKFSYCLLNI